MRMSRKLLFYSRRSEKMLFDIDRSLRVMRFSMIDLGIDMRILIFILIGEMNDVLCQTSYEINK